MTEQERPRTEAWKDAAWAAWLRAEHPGAASLIEAEGRQQAVHEAKEQLRPPPHLIGYSVVCEVLDRVAGLNASESPATRDDLCPDCGHHLHRPNPGTCQWYDCGCGDASESGQPSEREECGGCGRTYDEGHAPGCESGQPRCPRCSHVVHDDWCSETVITGSSTQEMCGCEPVGMRIPFESGQPPEGK